MTTTRSSLAAIFACLSLTGACQPSPKENAKDAPTAQEPQGSLDQAVGPEMMQAIRLTNLAELSKATGVGPYHDLGFRGQNVTIAILDNGFDGLELSRGATLPAASAIEPSFTGQPAQTSHGTHMAELAYALATGTNDASKQKDGPELLLYVTNGPYENLESAVNDLIAKKRRNPERPMIVLYSQVWEFGGNGDGRGYINRLVNLGVDAGLLWVNAAGNLGQNTYTDQVKIRKAGELALPVDERYLEFKVAEGPAEIRLVLGWDNFTDSYYNYRTAKDLDLILEKGDGSPLGAGQLVQDGKDHGSDTGYSRHAREMIRATLPDGAYRLRVVAKSTNFEVSDRFWVAVGGNKVTLENANGDNIVFAPADNPRVLTVGASDVSFGNRRRNSEGREIKPECLAPSKVTFNDGSWAEGTSTAAAIAAGVLATYISQQGSMAKADLDQALEAGVLGTISSTTAPSLTLPKP